LIKGIIKLKTRCILAYCHSMLLESEMLLQEGKGIVIIDNEVDKNKVRDLGLKFIEFCELNSCTKDYLESKIPYLLASSAKRYYGDVIRTYGKYFKDRHIPLLFAIILFQRLSVDKVVNIDIFLLQENIDIFLKSQKLEHKEIKSLFNKDKTRAVNVEVLKYFDCVEDMLSSLKKKRKAKKRK